MDHSEENRISESNQSKRKRAYERPIVVRHAPLSRITSVSAASAPHSAAPPPGPPPISDIRLKEGITLLRHLPSGIGLYRYRYKSGTQAYVGVMAQEVAGFVPAAVVLGDDGFLRVNYDKLGLRLTTWDDWKASGGQSCELPAVS
jgi:hypothetical protein